MSVEQNKANVTRLLDELYNKGNPAVLPDLLAPGYVMHGNPEVRGAFWEEPDARSVEELNRELANRGYRVDWRTEYLSRNLDGGKRLLVPLQTVALEYHGQ